MSFKNFRKSTFIILILLLPLSCKDWDSTTKKSLEIAGANKKEIEKVLIHYKRIEPDPLKLRAAKYLINNMVYQYSFKGPAVDSLNNVFEEIYGVSSEDRNSVFMSDSSKKRITGVINAEYDITKISSKLLIDQIESAFNVYNQFEWSRNYSFKTFCEYILPYKFGESYPVLWRNKAFEQYSPLISHLSFSDKNKIFESEMFINTDTQRIKNKKFSGDFAYHLNSGILEAFEMPFTTTKSKYHMIRIYYRNSHLTGAEVNIKVDDYMVGNFIFPSSVSLRKKDKSQSKVEFVVKLDPGIHTLNLETLDKDLFIDYIEMPEYIKTKIPPPSLNGVYYLKNSLGSLSLKNDSFKNESKIKIHPNPSSETPIKIIPNDGGVYELVFKKESGAKKAIDAYPFGDKKRVIVYESHGYSNQQWYFIPVKKGRYQIRNKETGKILGYSSKDSTLIQLPKDKMRDEYIWQLQKLNSPHSEGLENEDMSIRVARMISEVTDRFQWSGAAVNIGPINPKYLLDYPYGSCIEEANFQTMILRSMGIACTVDFVLNYPERGAGHAWSVIFDFNGNTVQNNCHNPVGEGTWVDKYSKGKVYRKTNTINLQSLFIRNNDQEPIPSEFDNPYFIDVTQEYCDVRNIKIGINSKVHNKFGYLMVFDYKNWVPIGWGVRDLKNIEFKNVESNVLYLPSLYTNGTFKPFNLPFYFDSKGNITFIKANTDQLQKMTLKRKFPNRLVDDNLKKRIIGGEFQGANKSDFSDALTLATITEDMTDPTFHTINVASNKKFKYFRYKGPDGGYSNISELVFLDKKGNVINGDIVGTNASFENGENLDKAFDNDVLTYFNSSEPTGGWVGLKLKQPQSLSKIRFIARNDGNMIEIGDKYELVYWNSKWISLGQQTATSDSLIFKNVPTNGLYLLHNKTKGREERIFTYRDGKQIWW